MKPSADKDNGTSVLLSNPSGEFPQGLVNSPASTPRLYVVEIVTGKVRRNSNHLVSQVSNENAIATKDIGNDSTDQADPIAECRTRGSSLISAGHKDPATRYRESMEFGELRHDLFVSYNLVIRAYVVCDGN